MSSFTIDDAEFPADEGDVIRMMRDYADWLGVDIGFQGFESEIKALPGEYAPPSGALLVLRDSDGQPVGCAAFRDLGQGRCELKRMYLDIAARGQGQGRALGEAIMERARAAGYRRIVLDTLDYMGAAVKLYDRLGFQPIAPYYNNPLPGAIYFGRDL
ncbi:GNAT family N-acetyltransferase [Paracoccus tegillarcae]|uniref:GNAT family N-acetyltransferase n=1 Tax=Paracoccus tegillarcae TaxID=1529068 RepID=A0A2K9EZ39_9RHOB|nr:GNAT family N-acetyltransferase [Paracoccus tegillarcae]AUH33372.1 GNAT family N-acetyltransferase [Paracoccus tegillarcae]